MNRSQRKKLKKIQKAMRKQPKQLLSRKEWDKRREQENDNDQD